MVATIFSAHVGNLDGLKRRFLSKWMTADRVEYVPSFSASTAFVLVVTENFRTRGFFFVPLLPFVPTLRPWLTSIAWANWVMPTDAAAVAAMSPSLRN